MELKSQSSASPPPLLPPSLHAPDGRRGRGRIASCPSIRPRPSSKDGLCASGDNALRGSSRALEKTAGYRKTALLGEVEGGARYRYSGGRKGFYYYTGAGATTGGPHSVRHRHQRAWVGSEYQESGGMVYDRIEVGVHRLTDEWDKGQKTPPQRSRRLKRERDKAVEGQATVKTGRPGGGEKHERRNTGAQGGHASLTQREGKSPHVAGWWGQKKP